MELSFVLEAIRRYVWLVVLFGLVGALPGLVASQRAAVEFESRAVLMVVPARDARVQINVTGENERYVLGQLAVLSSDALADRVATSSDVGIDSRELLESLTVNHIPQTDIVEVAIRRPDPAEAQLLTNAYVEAYLSSLSAQVTGSESAEVERLGAELDQIRAELASVDLAIAEALQPFLAATSGDGDSSFAQVPTPDQVVPGLVSERQTLLMEFGQVLTAWNELRIGSPLRVATEVVERATAPSGPAPATRGRLIVVAGGLVGIFLGVLAATVLARLSPRVLSRRHATEVLDVPVLGPVRWNSNVEAAVQRLTAEESRLVDSLRIKVDATAHTGSSVVVVVAGVSDRSVVAPLATALAAGWAREGLRTLLVHADPSSRKSTARPGGDGRGLSELVERSGPSVSLTDVTSQTGVQGLLVVGPGRSHGPFRRPEAERFLDRVSERADVIVVDVGELMGSTVGSQLVSFAEALVLVVPQTSTVNALEMIHRQLRGSELAVLPVWMRHGRSLQRASLASETPSSDSTDDGLDGSQAPSSRKSDDSAEAAAGQRSSH